LDRNTLLAIALSLLVLSAWSTWEASRQPSPEPTAESPIAGGADPSGDGPDSDRASPVRDADSVALEEREVATPGSDREAAKQPGSDRVATSEWQAVYDSELYSVRIENRGGGISSWKLLDPLYTVGAGSDETPIELITAGREGVLALATPLEGLGIGDLSEALFEVESASAEHVSFYYERDGIGVRKIYRFDPEHYLFDLKLEVTNSSGQLIRSDVDIVWPAEMVDGNDFKEQALIALANEDVEREQVPSVGSGGFFGFLGGGEDDGPTTLSGIIEWAGVSNRFFVSALLPDERNQDRSRVTFMPVISGERAETVLSYDDVEIRSGETVDFGYEVYIGPKVAAELEKIRPGFERSIDLGYSWLEPLTKFFHWLLGFFYSVIPNYGVAIVLVTVLVRVVTLPIMNRQMRSMERMRELQPKLKEIQEKFKEDRQRQSEEQMKLYKEEGVNPLGGCLPMLLQFPVFIGLFYSLQSEIALRHAPFVLWITDLSAPEALFTIPGVDFPIRVLPILMGGSMVLQQKMTPTTGMDPAQAKMMSTVMPIMMLVLFYQFPSGLVLYWMISNFLGIGHQLWVRRGMQEAGAS
jgi:YidC/Oxa1 family membrane protein insertase